MFAHILQNVVRCIAGRVVGLNDDVDVAAIGFLLRTHEGVLCVRAREVGVLVDVAVGFVILQVISEVRVKPAVVGDSAVAGIDVFQE